MRLSAPRIPPLADADMDADQAAAKAALGPGPVLNLYRTFLHAPKAFTRFIHWGAYVLSRRNDLTPRDRELAILRTGWNCRSGYEWAQHAGLALECAISPDEIERLKRGDLSGWSEAETAILRATDELHHDQFISEACWRALSAHYTSKQIMDLVFTVAQYTQVSMILNSFGVQLDDGLTLDPDLTTAKPSRRPPPPPRALSDEAQAYLAGEPLAKLRWPALEDTAAWRRLIARRDGALAQVRAPLIERLPATLDTVAGGSCAMYRAAPAAERLLRRDQVLLDFHGGALIFSGGAENVRFEAASMALRTGRLTYAPDYRRPPDHPYPAAVDDGVAAYRVLLDAHPAASIILVGTSAGGNIAIATLLKARRSGLAMPKALLLLTPETDLAESGDSFQTLLELDPVLQGSLRAPNQLYAGDLPLDDPRVSPVNDDLSGFPPAFVQSGTRDLFLSNAVTLHRRLRDVGGDAELHVWDAMPHGGFGGRAPEDRDVSAEMRRFLDRLI